MIGQYISNMMYSAHSMEMNQYTGIHIINNLLLQTMEQLKDDTNWYWCASGENCILDQI